MSIERAIAFAAQAHEGQLDKSGVPYIYHPLRVCEAVRHLGDNYARVAVLHDVVEDTKFAITEVRDICDLKDDEVWALSLVTRAGPEDPARVTYRKFIINIAVCGFGAGHIAKAVKIADIKDNLGRLTPELKGMEKRYKMALEILGEPYG